MKTLIIYSETYLVDIGAHVFPTSKYKRIRERLLKDISLVNRIEFKEPAPATYDDALRVHTREYMEKLTRGKLSYEEILILELPYSKELIKSSFLCCGGTILAARVALADGVGIHLGGGFHHAFADHGEGFCVLNDIAVALKKLISEKKVKKALVIDCDLHQGNGTASIFANDKNVFTFSIHQENNYPFYKPKSNMDIGLPDRAKDKEYIDKLEENIPKIISSFRPEIILYVAGADPYEHDKIGNLAVTKRGLLDRDEFIYSQAINYQIPLGVVLAGGYAEKEEDTVDIHFNTIKSAVNAFNRK